MVEKEQNAAREALKVSDRKNEFLSILNSKEQSLQKLNEAQFEAEKYVQIK